MRFIIYLFLLPAFNVCVGQELEKLNDSAIANFLSAFKNTCNHLVSTRSGKINVRRDRRALENTTKLVKEFQAFGKLTNIDDHFQLIESVTVGNTTTKTYKCITSNRGGNLNIYIEHKEDRDKRKDRFHLFMLTSSHLYCGDDNRLVATFDALYLRELLKYIGFRFRLDKWEDQFFLYIDRKW